MSRRIEPRRCIDCRSPISHSGRRCDRCQAEAMHTAAVLLALMAHDKSKPEAVREAALQGARSLGIET